MSWLEASVQVNVCIFTFFPIVIKSSKISIEDLCVIQITLKVL